MMVHPGTQAKTVWYGVVLQDQNYGEGYFMTTNNGGKVTLEVSEVIEELPE